ncbi:MAG: CoA pyrophosphatase [Bauldia sp.]|nr:CoA pyrophosphatase [Bauldia sp.]
MAEDRDKRGETKAVPRVPADPAVIPEPDFEASIPDAKVTIAAGVRSAASARFFDRAPTVFPPYPVLDGPATGEGFVLPGRPSGPPRDAAVLMPVVDRRPDAAILLTRRTETLSTHAGQIAFPGGKVDPADADPVACALREAEEEIGLPPSAVEVLGCLPPFLTGTGFRVFPVLARIEPGYRLALNPAEVADAFEVPLAFLMDAGNHRRGSRVFNGVERSFYEMPFGGHYIWGVTAGIIRILYERMYP